MEKGLFPNLSLIEHRQLNEIDHTEVNMKIISILQRRPKKKFKKYLMAPVIDHLWAP